MPQNIYQKQPKSFEGKKVEYSAMAKSNSIEHAFHLLKTKLKAERPTTTEVSCSKDLAKHHKAGNPVSDDVHEFQT